MRSTRGSSDTDLSRAERADAASRRLALLAADLGATDPDPHAAPWPPDDGDFTRVVPSRRPVPPEPVPVGRPAEPPVVPRPGRHASRRRPAWTTVRVPGLPGLGASQLAVLAVIVAAAVALTAWWVVRDQAAPVAPTGSPPPSSAQPLVAPTPGSGASPVGTTDTVTVDVTGKVRRPGIVVLDTGARVVDALKAAGGE